MNKIKFYICNTCGNVIVLTNDAKVSCCGRELNLLETINNEEKHIPKISKVEYDYYITFEHEMKKEHYISFVAYVKYDKVLLTKLYPEQNAQLRIPNMGEGKLYYYCTKHGLYSINI